MSSFISEAERKLARELGAHALLEKPFRLTDLLQKVGELACPKEVECGIMTHSIPGLC